MFKIYELLCHKSIMSQLQTSQNENLSTVSQSNVEQSPRNFHRSSTTNLTLEDYIYNMETGDISFYTISTLFMST